MTDVDAGPNAEQATYWSEASGPKWVAYQERIDAQIAPLGLAAIERAAPRPGERCLDVGCGCGQTTLQLAERVAPEGSVLGVDLSVPMLARAEERAREAGLPARFARADAQTHDFSSEGFDLVFSRFGVMFFSDPVAAFANLRGALAGSGRLAFACWRPPVDNDWVVVPLAAARKHLEVPAPTDPFAPGPFSLADPDRIRRVLADAGWSGIEIDAHSQELEIAGGASQDEALDFLMQIGPMARLLAEAEPAVAARGPRGGRAGTRPVLPRPSAADGVGHLGGAGPAPPS